MNAMFTQMITLLSKGVLAAGALLAVWGMISVGRGLKDSERPWYPEWHYGVDRRRYRHCCIPAHYYHHPLRRQQDWCIRHLERMHH